MSLSKASIIVLSWNGMKYLEDCLSAALEQAYPDFELIVVDNASTDGSAEFVAVDFPQVRLVRNERNLGFAGGNNVGLRAAKGDMLVLLNQDTVVQPGWLMALAETLQDSSVGIAGSKILDFDRKALSHAGGRLLEPTLIGVHIGAGEWDEGQYDEPADVKYVTGAAMATRRDVIDRVGLLDESFFPAYYEDVDWCLRVAAAGFKIRYCPRATVWHDESSSTRNHWPRKHYFHYRARLMLLLKHFSPEFIVEEFAPAEAQRLQHVDGSELRAAHAALAERLAMSELDPNLGAAQSWKHVLAALEALRQLTLLRCGGDSLTTVPVPDVWRGDIAAARSGATPPSEHGDRQARLSQNLEALHQTYEVKERPFRSAVPLLGPVIVALRSLWNSVATRWYVLPILEQQNRFNAASARNIRDIYAELDTLAFYWDSDAVILPLVERQIELEQQLRELGRQIEEIQSELEGRREG
jgi:GT2 family glycosyltransferase